MHYLRCLFFKCNHIAELYLFTGRHRLIESIPKGGYFFKILKLVPSNDDNE